jgi:hypothetical protein
MPSAEVFDKWKSGQLRSGGDNGPKVPPTKRGHRQAIAIFLSEKRNEGRNGGKYRESGRRSGRR